MSAEPRLLIHLIAGSTGAGKTTYAMALADRLEGIRFSIDEWMTTLFWMDSPQPIEAAWAMERVRRCSAQIWTVAVQAAHRGVPAILDVGLTRAEDRAGYARLADTAGLPVQLHFIDIPSKERWRRVQTRNDEKGATYRLEVTRQMFDFVETLWESPTERELAALNGVRIGVDGVPVSGQKGGRQ